MTATRKTTTKPKPAPRKVKPTLYQTLKDQQRKSDPIYKAIDAWEKALGRALSMPDSLADKERTKILDAVSKAEYRVAETVPTTFDGIQMSARWFSRFVGFHDGIGNLDGYYPVEVWPQTIKTAIDQYDRREDPVRGALSWYRACADRHNNAQADNRQLETDYIDALADLQDTVPTTGAGLAVALKAFVEDANVGDSLSEDQLKWAEVLIAAASVLP
jgi:hypothetical protein